MASNGREGGSQTRRDFGSGLVAIGGWALVSSWRALSAQLWACRLLSIRFVGFSFFFSDEDGGAGCGCGSTSQVGEEGRGGGGSVGRAADVRSRGDDAAVGVGEDEFGRGAAGG
ncbi:hypothetical protein TIFTF001_015013 [Ficus carica]|uniref:Uncharacterized protein n=1 Tax=Ficus carica TaxID=3494 RepID=A0AA88D4N3_FICCA|nr:hypothetical protein TIFTF001_015013 [Ficus carica]